MSKENKFSLPKWMRSNIWSIWNMDKSTEKYLKESILKPYLVHVEFELENILNKVQKDTTIRNVYIKKGFDINLFENDLNAFLYRLRQLQSIFRI